MVVGEEEEVVEVRLDIPDTLAPKKKILPLTIVSSPKLGHHFAPHVAPRGHGGWGGPHHHHGPGGKHMKPLKSCTFLLHCFDLLPTY